MSLRVVVLPGDGIGPEVTREAAAVLEKAAAVAGAELALEERRIGGAGLDAEGTPLSHETLGAGRSADSVLLGAGGGPKRAHPIGANRVGAGLRPLRKGMGGVRPQA